MKAKTASTPENKRSSLREPKSPGIANAVPPPAPVAPVPVAPAKSASVPKSSARKTPKKPLIETMVNAAKKILKPKAKAVSAKAAESVPPVESVKAAESAIPTAAKVSSAKSPVETPKVEPVAPEKPAESLKAAPAKSVSTKKAAQPANPAEPVIAPAPLKIDAPARAIKPVEAELPPEGRGELKSRLTATPRKPSVRRKKIEAPAILSESDSPAAPSLTGPGEKYSLGPTPVSPGFDSPDVELPRAYGTKKLFLTARDPHWLYAHWDLTLEQQHALNAESSDGHLVLRVYDGKLEGHPLYEIHVHPESRHWFVHVEKAGSSYCAELGYYSPLGKWTRVAVSSATVTPPDAASHETDVEFATIPFEFPFAKLMRIIEEAVRDNLPLAQAIEELRRAGHPDLPRIKPAPSHGPALSNGGSGPAPTMPWTEEQEQALSKVICIDQSRRVWMGSLEITELIRRRLNLEVSSPMRAFGLQGVPSGISSLPASAVSSPAVPFGAAPEKSFWFNVNAELIIYGATEPGAKVTLGGHEIKLRADGTFSYRFALPDGKYDLPAVAVSADGTDARSAGLKFSRETEYSGDVGAHPQDPSLKAPLAGNLPENL